MVGKKTLTKKSHSEIKKTTKKSTYLRRKEHLKKLLKLEPDEELKSYHIPYIYTHFPKWCCKIFLKPTFNNIEPYQWNKLNKQLIDTYKGIQELSFYKEQAKIIKKLPKNQTLNLGFKSNFYVDQLILDFHKARIGSRIVTAYPNISPEELKELKSYFKNYKLVYAYKKIELTQKQAISLIYQTYGTDLKRYDYNYLKKETLKLGWENPDKKDIIHVWLIDTKDKNHLKKINQDLNRISKLVRISNYFIESIELAQIYFNKNSLIFLERQLLDRHLSIKYNKCRIFINTFKQWIYKNLDLINKDRFIILSGAMFYTHGLRNCGDLDMLISSEPSPMTKDIEYKINKFFIDEKTKFPFADAYEPNLKWLEFWDQWHITWANGFGAKIMLETIHNPKYHYYFMGIKFIYMEAEIVRRNIRSRPSSIADLIMLEKYMGITTNINPIQKTIIKNGEIRKYEKDKFSKFVQYYLKNKYDVKMSLSDIQTYIVFQEDLDLDKTASDQRK